MAVNSNPSPSPSLPPSLQPSSTQSSNPWNRNLSGPLPAPVMGGSSSWPPLPSSSQIDAAVTATAVTTVEQTPDKTSSMEVIDPPSIPAAASRSDPLPESTLEPLPLPESTPELDRASAQERTAPSAAFDAPPRPSSAPRRRGPNHAAPNHHRGRNYRPQHWGGSRAPFFPGGNGGNFNPLLAPNWNGGFGFGLMWPPHQPMGIPLGVPFPGGPPLDYYDVNLPPVPIHLPHYGASVYPEWNGFYNFPLLPPGSLPFGAVPVGPHVPPPLPPPPPLPRRRTPMYLDQKVALAPPPPPPPPAPPMVEDQKPSLQPPPPPPAAVPPTIGDQKPSLQPTPPPLSMTEDHKAGLLVDLRKQIEYYFSDQNLVRDEYLKRQMDDEGWVDIHTIARFRRVAAQTADLKVIKEALSSSDSVELQDNKMRKKDGWARYCIPKN